MVDQHQYCCHSKNEGLSSDRTISSDLNSSSSSSSSNREGAASPRIHHQQQQHHPCCVKPHPSKDQTSSWSCEGVSFGSVQVREYNRSLGDWLNVPHGLAIGWEYLEHDPEPLPQELLEDNESNNQYNKNYKSKPKGMLFLSKQFFQKLPFRSTNIHTPTLTRTRSSNLEGRDELRPAPLHSFLAKLSRNRRRFFVHPSSSLRESSSSSSSSLSTCTTASSASKGCNGARTTIRYDRNPTTSSERFETLQQFGFSSDELQQAELQRERVKFEQYLEDSLSLYGK
ncbi:hypothetical protein IV203_014003 [Nitzschia inconspicua]|uniref:Uncharacterized protein n=1 Tax=Nitzschia inconspicua TaxID=303405 RepID=A0A9K3Q8G8_9STRA|nr:hypothetical protein IV203_014215 [Nitzschia inconspicua]KAG7374908.1 hypothetical protein IV203_014003 [Nitzschia inconspicua]